MARSKSGIEWDAEKVRALRRFLGLTQQEMAEELGIRQQTVSEWETGVYKPRGPSLRLLGWLAEREGFSPETRGTPRTSKSRPKQIAKPKGAQEVEKKGEDWAPWE